MSKTEKAKISTPKQQTDLMALDSIIKGLANQIKNYQQIIKNTLVTKQALQSIRKRLL